MTAASNPVITLIKDKGWLVSYRDGSNAASTTVTFEEYDILGEKAFDEAIDFVKRVAKDGYG